MSLRSSPTSDKNSGSRSQLALAAAKANASVSPLPMGFDSRDKDRQTQAPALLPEKRAGGAEDELTLVEHLPSQPLEAAKAAVPPVEFTPRTPRKVGLQFPSSEVADILAENDETELALAAVAAAAAAEVARRPTIQSLASSQQQMVTEIRLIDFGLACQLFRPDELIQAGPTPEPPEP